MMELLELLKLLLTALPYVKQLKARSYENRVKELNKCIQNLKKQRKTVERIAKEQEIRYSRGIDGDVLKWVKGVDDIISMYDNFYRDEDRPYAVCSEGYLPKPGIRCRLSTIVNDIISKVNHLLQEAPKRDEIGYSLGALSFDFGSSDNGYQSYPSRERTMDDIMKALKDLSIQVIGVYGWNGVGKTTLVKEVVKKVNEKDTTFDTVFMVNVTSPDIREIQGQIADWLGMKLEEESNSGRAARIRERLKDPKQNTLIVLDDLREKMDFNMIGIPFAKNDDNKVNRKENYPSDFNLTKTENYEAKKFHASSLVKTKEPLTSYRGCKILLISDSKQLLLSQVDWKGIETYCVGALEEKEAENLFKHMAEIDDESSQFETLATQIAKKCGGLPMTIVTIASALQNKNLMVWEDKCRKLEKQNLKAMPELSTNLSYDLLEDEELKHFLLICASMGHDALISDLVRFCIGLGLLQDIYTVREARIRVHMLVEQLKELRLLSDSFSSDRFTMQDIVRKAALSISSKEMHAFSLIKGKLDEWPDKDKLERYTAISLQHCEIIEFPENISCPKLRIFHVDNNDAHMKIPDNFFSGMEELRVLILTGIDLSSLPWSIESLTKLRMLCLERCKLGEGLSIIGKLKKLRVLSLSGSDIDELPVELKQLTKLQIFDLSNCSKLGVIPTNVLSCMANLEELYIRNSFIQWNDEEKTSHFEKKIEGVGGQSENVSLSELRQLNQLRTLEIQIPNIAQIPKNLFFDKLDTYKIIIGDFNANASWHFKKMQETYEASRILALHQENGFNIHSQKVIKMLFKRVQNLMLGQLNDVEDVFYDLNCEGFPCLKYLSIVNNSKVKSIINSENQQHAEEAFPQLESLFLCEVNMEHICKSQLTDKSFCKLNTIKLNMCGQLKNVFFFLMIKHFSKLETIEVSECNSLEEIVALDRSCQEEVIEFPKLLSLTLQSLPQFIGFCIRTSQPGEFFNKKVVVSKLERLKLFSIKIQKLWGDQPSTTSCFQNLAHLDVNDCRSLKYLLSFSMAKNLINLQSLFISDCTILENIIEEDSRMVETKESIIFPKLKYINLSSMKRLKKIWHSKVPVNSFGKLDTLIIEGCNKLVNVFPSYMVGRFPSLSTLKVADCKSMKEIFDLKGCGQRNADDATNLQNVQVATLPKLEHIWNKDPKGILNFKNLQKICVQECPNLKSIFPASSALSLEKLEYLEVWDCGELEDIVAVGESGKSTISYKLPKLTTARFWKLPKLQSFYGEQEISCLALNDLSLELCHKLKLIRSAEPEMRQVFFLEKAIYNLKSMQIELPDANLLKTYIGNYRMHKLEELHLSRLKDAEILYFFLYRNPNLKSLMLSNCFLKELVPPENHNEGGVIPNLTSLKLINLPSLEKIGFEEDPIFQIIECLILKECSSLTTIAPSSLSFTCLTNLEVSNCNKLKYLMAPSTAKSLVQLTSMKVSQCESMQSIIEPEEANETIKIVFRQLQEIELVGLHKLENFCSSCSYALEFPSLEKFTVGACGKMETFSKEQPKCTPVLQQIYVRHGKEETQSHWKGDLNATIQELHGASLLGPEKMAVRSLDQLQGSFQLKTLKLMTCTPQGYAVPTAFFSSLKNLEELLVCNTHAEVIFGESGIKTKGNTFRLKKLTLEKLPNLNHVWDGDHDEILSFQNLQEVIVTKCENLKTLFPAELAKNLEKLQKLEISSCGQLESIVEEKEAGTDAKEELSFPRLTSLALRHLPRLVCFHPHRFTVECPDLNHLEVLFCDHLEIFPSGQVAQVSTSAGRQPNFFHVKVISNLESLKLDWKNTNMLCRENYSENMLHRLVQLEVDFDDADLQEDFDFDDVKLKKPEIDDGSKQALNFPIELLKRASNLENLQISQCRGLEELFPSQPEEGEIAMLEPLDTWSRVCKELQILSVSFCPYLTTLVHSAVSFSNLKQLFIQACKGLKHLFTSSTAKELVHLEEMYIVHCGSIEEILAKEVGGTTSEAIKLERLNTIVLDSLSILQCFYPGTNTLQLPSLIKLLIWRCPNMKTFSKGAIAIDSFKGIHVTWNNQDGDLLFHQDLNNTVDTMFKEKEFLERMDDTDLSEYLRVAWRGKVRLESYDGLKTMKLVNCKVQQCLISSDLLYCLNNLKDLKIKNCRKVKVVFSIKGREISERASRLERLTLKGLSELTHVWENNCEGILSFQNLKVVTVKECKNLQSLFPAALAKNLKKLENLVIQSCDGLIEIVGKVEDTEAGITEKFVLPCLKGLYLQKLPRLTYFYHDTFTLECPALEDLTVWNCLGMELCSSAHPNKDKGDNSSSSTNRQPLFSNLKAIPNFKTVRLGWEHISVLPHLKDPKLLEEIFLKTSEEYCVVIKGRLKELRLERVSDLHLQSLWSENSQWLNPFFEKLRKFEVFGCHLTELVHSTSTLSYSNLKELQVSQCAALKYLFTFSVAKTLMQLEEIRVDGCESMKEIVAKEQEEATSEGIIFPRLNRIYLDTLSSLECFYSGNATLQLPSLSHINIVKCFKMETFSHGSIEANSFQGIDDQNNYDLDFHIDLNSSEKKLFLLQKFDAGMDELTFSKHLQQAWHGEVSVQSNLFDELETMRLVNCEVEPCAIPSHILKCLKSLKELQVRDCNKVKVIFDTKHTEIMEIKSQLQKLTLDGLWKLTHVWEKNCVSTDVKRCPPLTALVRSISTITFSNLKELHIYGCNALQYLFTFSIAKTLLHLEEIKVKECKSMKEIVAKEQEEATSEGIIFERLHSIHLYDLSSLECFYSGNATLQLPSLTQVDIEWCPKMEIFSLGSIEANSFQGVQNRDELVFHIDLNCSVKKLFLQQDHLVFENSSLLKEIWHLSMSGPPPKWCFCNLTSMVVEGCDFLSNAILPSHLLPLLSNLKKLLVRKCNSLNAIFSHPKVIDMRSQGSLILPFLEKLHVENCEKLVAIVANDEANIEEAHKELNLSSSITSLRLLNLPSLSCIYPGRRILEWGMLKELCIKHCQMLKFFPTEFKNPPDSHPEEQDSVSANRQVSVSLEKVTPRLEVLWVGKEEAMMIEEGKLHIDLQHLNSLQLHCFQDESHLLPFVFASRVSLPSIQNFGLLHSSFKEIFPSQSPDHIHYTKFLSQLTRLKLQSLSKLKSIGLEHSWMHPFVENLNTLLVWECPYLTNLSPSTVSFSNLVQLKVKNCGGLKYLFTSSTAKTLGVLKEMHITNCKLIKAIMVEDNEEEDAEEEDDDDDDDDEEEDDDDDDDEEDDEDEDEECESDEQEEEEGESDEQEEEGESDEQEEEGESDEDENDYSKGENEIIFRKLEILSLSKLPKLGSFYTGSSTLNFPSLERVFFTQCHNTKIFRPHDAVPKGLWVQVDGFLRGDGIDSLFKVEAD